MPRYWPLRILLGLANCVAPNAEATKHVEAEASTFEFTRLGRLLQERNEEQEPETEQERLVLVTVSVAICAAVVIGFCICCCYVQKRYRGSGLHGLGDSEAVIAPEPHVQVEEAHPEVTFALPQKHARVAVAVQKQEVARE